MFSLKKISYFSFNSNTWSYDSHLSLCNAWHCLLFLALQLQLMYLMTVSVQFLRLSWVNCKAEFHEGHPGRDSGCHPSSFPPVSLSTGLLSCILMDVNILMASSADSQLVMAVPLRSAVNVTLYSRSGRPCIINSLLYNCW